MEIALGAIREAIVWCERSGAILWSNSSFQKMIGCPAGGLERGNVIIVAPLLRDGGRIQDSQHPLNLVALTGRPISGIFEFVMESRRYTLDVIAHPVAMANEADTVILVLRDISMQVDVFERFEEKTRALIKAHELLKEQQAQMIRSEKMAAFGLLSAGVAHEINNPVTFIRSNFNMMKKYRGQCEELVRRTIDATNDEAESRGCENCAGLRGARGSLDLQFLLADFDAMIEESIEGTERIIRIVRGLKEFAHADPGELALVDINEIVEQALTIVWNEIKYKAEVDREFGTLPKIVGNPRELGQVFMNLLINAVQALDSHGRINVRTREDDGNLRIVIEDDGCGIPASIQGRIFDPFFTTKPVGSGTGLGLHISRKIVEGHGGVIRVESVEGSGTIVTVILPKNSGIYSGLCPPESSPTR